MNQELASKVKKLVGDDAEGVTVMWCDDNGSHVSTLGNNEGAMAAEVVKLLKWNSIAASIVNQQFQNGEIPTNSMTDDIIGFADGLLRKMRGE
jgi:hypothetical protein